MPRLFFVLFGAILLVVGTVALVGGVFTGLDEGRFGAEAVETDATVVDKAIDRDSDDDTDYLVTYTFTPPDGFDVTRSQEIDRDEWDALQPGNEIRVEYLPDDPSRSRVVGTGGWVGPIIAAVFGGIAAPAGAVLTLIGVRRIRRHRQILREGIAVPATVIGPEATNIRVNRQQQWVVVYRYVDRMGGEHMGRSDPMAMHRALEWQPGSTAVIRYAGDHPDESVWVGIG